MILQHIICSKCGNSMENVGIVSITVSPGWNEIMWKCKKCGNLIQVKEGEEIMKANKEWACDCWKGKVFKVAELSRSSMDLFDDMKFCPYCGKERPEEPKALYLLLHEFHDASYGVQAIEILKWVKDILPDTQPMHKGHTEQDYRDDLIELLDKEKERCS